MEILQVTGDGGVGRRARLEARLGHCYELAGQYTMGHPGTTVVHGSIQGFGNPRIDHAWVILENCTVLEPVSEQVYDPDAFEAVFDPLVSCTYDTASLCAQALRTRHWGPWTEAAA